MNHHVRMNPCGLWNDGTDTHNIQQVFTIEDGEHRVVVWCHGFGRYEVDFYIRSWGERIHWMPADGFEVYGPLLWATQAAHKFMAEGYTLAVAR